MKKISIIVPVYNMEKYLGQCLDSILKQTYENIEIIVVNDGSTDQTLLICHQYAEKDSRIRLICQEHAGISAARNIGLEDSNGDLITFVQPEDSIEPNYVSDLVQQLDQAKSDIGVTFYKVYDEQQGAYMVLIDPDPGDDMYDGCCSAIEWFKYVNPQLKELSSSVWGKIFKRELFKNIRFRTDFSYCGDEEAWWQLCLLADTISFQNKINYTHRINQKNKQLDRFAAAKQAREHTISFQEQLTMMLVCGIDVDYLKNDFYSTLQTEVNQAENVGDFNTYQQIKGNLQIINCYLKGTNEKEHF